MRPVWIVLSCSLIAGQAFAALPEVPGFEVTEYAPVIKPMRMSFDAEGNLYVGNNEPISTTAPVIRITAGGGTVEPYGPPLLDADVVLVHDPASGVPAVDGAVLVGGVVDPSRGYLAEIRPDLTVHELFLPNVEFLNPTDLAYDGQTRLLMTDVHDDAVFVSTGGPPVVLCSVFEPVSIVVDALDRIIVLCSDGNARLYDTAGVLLDDAYLTGIGNNPGMVFGPGGVWGTDLYTVRGTELVRIDPAGAETVVGTDFITASFGFPGLEFGPDGALYISDYSADRVLRIAPDNVAVADVLAPERPARLLRTVPNPFNAGTRIEWTQARPGRAAVTVYDVSGRMVRRLGSQRIEAGLQHQPWNGLDDAGRALPAGAYFYQLTVDGVRVGTGKALLARP